MVCGYKIVVRSGSRLHDVLEPQKSDEGGSD